MTTPQLALLVFALWTISIPLGVVGVVRWTLILSGRAAIDQFRADVVSGPDMYQRAMRAHANCVENLPVFAVIVLALGWQRIDGPIIDLMATLLIAARALQTLVHIALPQTPTVAGFRFAFFFVQLVIFYCLGALALSAAGRGMM